MDVGGLLECYRLVDHVVIARAWNHGSCSVCFRVSPSTSLGPPFPESLPVGATGLAHESFETGCPGRLCSATFFLRPLRPH